MRLLTSVARGLSNSMAKHRRDQEVNDEVSFHIASRADDLAARGLSSADALRQARLEFGGRDKYKEQIRDARGFRMLEDLVRDVAYAVRSLRRSPGLVIISVLSLGLGVGANGTLSSALSAVFLSVPTASAPEQLAWVEPGNGNQFSYLNYRDLRDSAIFADVVGYRLVRVSLRANAAAESISGMAVTSNFFEGLGVRAQIGRTFTRSETEAEARPLLVVLSHGFWVRRFGGDAAITAKTLALNGQQFSVVGVLPENYQAITPLKDPDVYVPLSDVVLPNLDSRQNANALNVLGRIGSGTTRQQTQAAVTALGRHLETSYPEANRGMRQPARLDSFGRLSLQGAPLVVKIFPPVLAALCFLILLIACANVAGLLLARATSRQRELALRVALGVTRSQLVRGLLAESFVLAASGAAVGVLVTAWLISVLRDTTLPTVGLMHLSMRPDLTLIASALLLVVITGLACGLLPALKATRADIFGPLHQGGHGSTAPLRLRHALVVTEVAASVVLLITSLLFLRTLGQLTTLNTGIDADHGIVATIELPPGHYTRARLLIEVAQVLDRLDNLAGIRSSTIADILPLGGEASSGRFEAENKPADRVRTLVNSVGSRYFETLGIPLLRGREFQPADRAGAPPVVIVSEAFARHYFPGEDPIGKRVRAGGDEPYAEIVGVVHDSNYESVGEAAKPLLYYSYAQRSVSSQSRPLRIHVRTSGLPAASLRTVTEIVAQLDRDAPVSVTTLKDAGFETGLRRASTLLLGWLGGLGLFLAMVGLYGVVSYIVASRTSEIGVRIALGASSAAVMWDVLKRGLTLTMWGLIAGSVVALAAARLLVALLAGVSPADPVAFGGTAVVLAIVGLLASYLPARRATRVNPLVALRDQ